jgi:flagellar biosynthesis/type III secretory pathway protein FliH
VEPGFPSFVTAHHPVFSATILARFERCSQWTVKGELKAVDGKKDKWFNVFEWISCCRLPVCCCDDIVEDSGFLDKNSVHELRELQLKKDKRDKREKRREKKVSFDLPLHDDCSVCKASHGLTVKQVDDNRSEHIINKMEVVLLWNNTFDEFVSYGDLMIDYFEPHLVKVRNHDTTFELAFLDRVKDYKVYQLVGLYDTKVLICGHTSWRSYLDSKRTIPLMRQNGVRELQLQSKSLKRRERAQVKRIASLYITEADRDFPRFVPPKVRRERIAEEFGYKKATAVVKQVDERMQKKLMKYETQAKLLAIDKKYQLQSRVFRQVNEFIKHVRDQTLAPGDCYYLGTMLVLYVSDAGTVCLHADYKRTSEFVDTMRVFRSELLKADESREIVVNEELSNYLKRIEDGVDWVDVTQPVRKSSGFSDGDSDFSISSGKLLAGLVDEVIPTSLRMSDLMSMYFGHLTGKKLLTSILLWALQITSAGTYREIFFACTTFWNAILDEGVLHLDYYKKLYEYVRQVLDTFHTQSDDKPSAAAPLPKSRLQDVMEMEIFSKLGSVLQMVFTFPFFVELGVPADVQKKILASHDFFKISGKVADVMDAVANFCQYLWDILERKIVHGDWGTAFSRVESVASFCMNAERLVQEEATGMVAGVEICKQQDWVDRAQKALANGKKLAMREGHGGSQSAIRAIAKLELAMTSRMQKILSVTVHKQPVVVTVYSACAGVGKTLLMDAFVRQIENVLHTVPEDGDIKLYTASVNMNDQFDSMITSKTRYITVDDIGQEIDPVVRGQSMSALLRFVNTHSVTANKARLEEKGTVPILPYAVLLSTNNKDMAKGVVMNVEAIYRRLGASGETGLFLEVAVKPALATHAGELDAAKLREGELPAMSHYQCRKRVRMNGVWIDGGEWLEISEGMKMVRACAVAYRTSPYTKVLDTIHNSPFCEECGVMTCIVSSKCVSHETKAPEGYPEVAEPTYVSEMFSHEDRLRRMNIVNQSAFGYAIGGFTCLFLTVLYFGVTDWADLKYRLRRWAFVCWAGCAYKLEVMSRWMLFKINVRANLGDVESVLDRVENIMVRTASGGEKAALKFLKVLGAASMGLLGVYTLKKVVDKMLSDTPLLDQSVVVTRVEQPRQQVVDLTSIPTSEPAPGKKVPWASPVYLETSRLVSPKQVTTSLKDLALHVTANEFMIEVLDLTTGVPVRTEGFVLSGRVLFFHKHPIEDIDPSSLIRIKLIRRNNRRESHFTCLRSKIVDGDGDIVALFVPTLEPCGDLSGFFDLNPDKVFVAEGMYVGPDPTGEKHVAVGLLLSKVAGKRMLGTREHDLTIFYRLPNRAGMCGSLLLAKVDQSVCIVGWHIAGDGAVTSVGVPLDLRKLKDMAVIAGDRDPIVMLAPFAPLDPGFGVTANSMRPLALQSWTRFMPKEDDLLKNGSVIGSVDYPQRSPESTVKRSPLKSYTPIDPDSYGPPVMRRCKDGGFEDPQSRAAKLSFHNSEPLNDTLIEAAARMALEHLCNAVSVDTTSATVISQKDAICSVAGSSLTPLDMKTSVGLPFRGLKSGHFIGPDKTPDAKIQAMIDRVHSEVSCGLVPGVIFDEVLKDEPVSAEKIKTGKTRAIQCGTAAFSIFVREMFHNPTQPFYKHRLATGCAVGINATSNDWKDLYEHFGPSKKKIDGDFKWYDVYLKMVVMYWAMWVGLMFFARNGCSKAHVVAMELASLAIINPVVNTKGDVYVTQRNASGQPLTSWLNCLCNLILFCAAWILFEMGHEVVRDNFDYSKHEARNFGECNSFIFYGDDNMVGTDEEGFDFYFIQRSMRSMGMYYTSSDKDQTSPPPFRAWDEVSFLKRGFRVDEKGRVLAPLEKKSLYKMLMYQMKSKVSPYEVLISNIENAHREWWMHGKPTFDFEMQRIRAAWDVDCPAVQIQWKTFEEMEEICGANYQ